MPWNPDPYLADFIGVKSDAPRPDESIFKKGKNGRPTKKFQPRRVDHTDW